MRTHDDLHVSSGVLITLLRVKQERGRKERSRASQRSPEQARRQGETQGKSRRRSPRAGWVGEIEKEGPRVGPERPRLYYPLSVTCEREMTEDGETQKEAPERPQSLISSSLRGKEDREGKEGGGRASQRSPEEASKERLRGSPGEGAPEQAEARETQREAPERPRSRLGLVF